MCLSLLPASAASPATNPLTLREVFLPLAFFSSLNVRYHKPNLVKGKSCSCSPSLPCMCFCVFQAFIPPLCVPGR